MERRDFLKKVAGSATAAVCFGCSVGEAKKKPVQPDILLIMPDQMRGDCLSILGHAAVKTEQLDELAREGVLFRRAYSTAATCIPARHAMLTSLYPQTSGVVGFKARAISASTMPELLAKAGYKTVLVGRNMHQVPEDKSYGYQRRILGSTYSDDDEYGKLLKRRAPETGGIKQLVKDLGLDFNLWHAKAWPLADDLHPTEWVVGQSRKVVEQQDVSEPLFLTASFYAPHPPLFAPKKYFDAYKERKLPKPAHGGWVDWKSLSPDGDGIHNHRILLEGEKLRSAQAGYYGLIEHLDSQVSPLIRDFKARSEKAGRPWVIVFTSDHGEMMGDHGYFRKGEPYEGSANIPMIVCGSKELGFKQGLQSKQTVCLEDIMPTLLDLAGAEKPGYIDGVSLVPTLRGGKEAVREWLHIEHAPCYSEAQAYHALTDGKFKYIWRPMDGKEQLFDLDQDPREENDLSQETSSMEMLKLWRGRLIERLANRPEGFSKDGRLIAGRPYKPLNPGTITTGPK